MINVILTREYSPLTFEAAEQKVQLTVIFLHNKHRLQGKRTAVHFPAFSVNF